MQWMDLVWERRGIYYLWNAVSVLFSKLILYIPIFTQYNKDISVKHNYLKINVSPHQ